MQQARDHAHGAPFCELVIHLAPGRGTIGILEVLSVLPTRRVLGRDPAATSTTTIWWGARATSSALLGPLLNLHASGGDGGITHPETDDYIPVMAQGVGEELADHDWGQTLRQRDELLTQLLAAKKDKTQLP